MDVSRNWWLLPAPLKAHLAVCDKSGAYLHPKAAATVRSQRRSGTLSNQFADLLAQAGLREKAPHHVSKGKGGRARRAANGLSFHSMRHTAVSLLKDAGIPEAVVMELVRTRIQSCERSLYACRHRSFGKGCRRFTSNLIAQLLKLGICV